MVFKGNIQAISDLFFEELSKDQSRLNRLLTESEWDVEGVEAERIRRFKEHPVLKPGKAWVIGIAGDDVLLGKGGEKMEGVGVLKDHSRGEYVLAHCLVTSSYYKGKWCYPLCHAPYFKGEVFKKQGLEFKSKVSLAKEIAQRERVMSEGIAGVFAFDAWYGSTTFNRDKGVSWLKKGVHEA